MKGHGRQKCRKHVGLIKVGAKIKFLDERIYGFCQNAVRWKKRRHIFGTLAKENMDTFMFTESIVGEPTE